MKKILSLTLAVLMVLSMAACAGTGDNNGTSEPTDASDAIVTGPASALELMETVWNAWDFEYKDYFMGGGYTNSVSGMPGAIEAADTDSLQYMLYVPEANLADVKGAASAMHGMNANTFTAAAFQVADASTFAATMKDTLMNNQWMCGIPENLMVYTLGEYVVIVFGAADNLNGFRTALTTAYADAVSVYDGVMG